MECCHISATMLGITWTERWLGDGLTEVGQLLPHLTPLDFFLWGYVKNIVKINNRQHLTAHTRDTVAVVTKNMLEAMWNEAEYRLDICFAAKGAHTEIY
jgi:hypothetical protein